MKVSATPNLDMRCTGRQTISFDFFHEQHFINGLLEESGVDEMDQLNPGQKKKLEEIRTKLDPLQEKYRPNKRGMVSMV